MNAMLANNVNCKDDQLLVGTFKAFVSQKAGIHEISRLRLVLIYNIAQERNT